MNKLRYKFLSAVLGITVVAVSLAGCGSSGKNTDKNS